MERFFSRRVTRGCEVRGIAVLSAALAVLVFTVRDVPRVSVRLPKIRFLVVLAALGAGLVGFLVAYGVLGSSMPALAIAVLCSAVPPRIEQSRIEKTASDHRDHWPDFITHMRSSVAAGSTMPDAFVDASQRVGVEFARYGDVVQYETTFGDGFSAALAQLRAELEDPVSDRVLATMAIAQQTGGHRVGDVLSALGSSVADDLRLRKAHDAALTEQRMTATVALVAPWALLSLSILTNPQAALAFDTHQGSLIVLGGLAATGLGWILARRASRLQSDPRLFT